MKNIIYILFGLLIFGCEKFLDEDSKDLVIPITVKDYGELLFGEAYYGCAGCCEKRPYLSGFDDRRCGG